MRPPRFRLFILLVPLVLLSGAASAQTAPAQNAAASNPGRELLLDKCAQCHSDAIWRDQRPDARAWEATLYRMLGRGGVWSGEEIKTMTAYLASDFGPNSPRPASAAR